MANDVEIRVRVTNQTQTGLTAIQRSMQRLRAAANESLRLTVGIDDDTAPGIASVRRAVDELRDLSPVRMRVEFDGNTAGMDAATAAIRGLDARASATEGSMRRLADNTQDASRALRTLRGRAAAAAEALRDLSTAATGASTRLRTLSTRLGTAAGRLDDVGGNVRTLRSDMDDLGGSVDGVNGGLGDLRGGLRLIGDSAGSAANAIGGGSGLRGKLIGAAVAAGTVLLPALGALSPIMFGLVGVGGAAALAFKGIGEEAKKLKPALEGMQKAATKAVMPGVRAGFKDLKAAMKDLHPVVKVGGQAFGAFTAKLGAFAKSPAFQGALLKNVQMGSVFFDKFTGSVLSFTQAFLDFGTKSKPTLDALTNGLSGLLGQGLPGMFKGLERGVGGTSVFLSGFFSMLNQLLPALGRFAGEVARTFGPLLGELAVNAGQRASAALGMLGGAVRLLTPVVKDLAFGVKATTQIFAIMAPTIKETAAAILGALVPAGTKIDEMRGPLQRLSESIERNKGLIQEGTRVMANSILDFVEFGISSLPGLIGAFRQLSSGVLQSLDVMVSGAASAFGWIPGIGDKLTAANRKFDEFKGTFLGGLAEAERKTREFSEAALPRLQNNRLKVNISNWQTQLATAKAQLKTVPPEKRARLLANIRDLESKIRQARGQLDSLDGKTAHTWVVTHFEARREGAHGTQLAYAHGGIVGAAGGGPRSRMTLVGEQGPELVDLAPGSRVRSNPDTRRMMSAAPAGDIGGQPLQITLVVDGKRLGEVVIDPLRKAVANRGGNVQAVLGRGRG